MGHREDNMDFVLIVVRGSEWSKILCRERKVLPIVPKCWTVHFNGAPIPKNATPDTLGMLPIPVFNYLEVVEYNELDDADKPYCDTDAWSDDADSD